VPGILNGKRKRPGARKEERKRERVAGRGIPWLQLNKTDKNRPPRARRVVLGRVGRLEGKNGYVESAQTGAMCIIMLKNVKCGRVLRPSRIH